ncbi:MAG: hypothetical protein ABEK59_08315 [Halobacteria archaeon]
MMKGSLFRRMMKEEWRIHSRLFGGWGFAAFPLVIFVLSAFAYLVLGFSGYGVERIETGLLYVLVFLGLNVGSVGLVGTDALENLLGESNLLIYSARTLPVEKKEVLANFIAKDLVYYTFLYVAPVTVGLLPVRFMYGDGKPLPVVWVAAVGCFSLGVGLSLSLSSLYNYRRSVLFGTVGLTATGLYLEGGSVLAVTPLGFFSNHTLQGFAVGLFPTAVLLFVGVRYYVPSSGSGVRRREDRYVDIERFVSRIDDETSGLVAKMFVDVLGSSGGYWKILFSVGLLFLVFVFLVVKIPFVRDVVAAPGIAFAVLLAISSTSVYHWINRFDRPEDYGMLPVDSSDLLRAKLVSGLLLSLPASYLYLVLGGVLFGFDEVLSGLVILPFVSMYVFGVSIYLTGFEPNSLLLNSRLFSIYTIFIMAVAVPLLVASISYSVFPLESVVFSLAGSTIAFLAGLFLYSRSKKKWSI